MFSLLTMETLFDRLLEICRDQGIDSPRGVDIQRVTGLSSGRVTQIKSAGPAGRVGDDALRKLIRLGYMPDWIQEGKGNKKQPPSTAAFRATMRRSLMDDPTGKGPTDEEVFEFAVHEGRTTYPASVNLSQHPDLREVPRVKFKLSAGVSGFAIEPESGNGKPVFFREDWFAKNNYRPEKLFAVLVSGSSMEPALWDGDLVVVNTDDKTPADGEAFAFNYEGELVIKRLRRDAGEWWAASDNTDQRRYSPKRCTEDVIILGRVVYKQSERI